MTERQAWIALASVVGVGEETMGLLISEFRSAERVLVAALDGALNTWNIAKGRLVGRVPIPARVMSGIEAVASEPQKKLGEIEDLGLWTYTSLDADYPLRLRDLDPPPAVIHGLGDRSLLSRPRAVAVVGTRRPTPAGRALATRISIRVVECWRSRRVWTRRRYRWRGPRRGR